MPARLEFHLEFHSWEECAKFCQTIPIASLEQQQIQALTARLTQATANLLAAQADTSRSNP